MCHFFINPFTSGNIWWRLSCSDIKGCFYISQSWDFRAAALDLYRQTTTNNNPKGSMEAFSWRAQISCGQGRVDKRRQSWSRQWRSCGYRRQAEKGAVITGKPSSNRKGKERVSWDQGRYIRLSGETGKKWKEVTHGLFSAVYNLKNRALGVINVKHLTQEDNTNI